MTGFGRCTERKLRLLCLHGMYQDASTFLSKTKYLRGVSLDVDFVFLDGPCTIVPPILAQRSNSTSNSPKRGSCAKKSTCFRAWWRPPRIRGEENACLDGDKDVLVEVLRRKLNEIGNVDGVIGFSQGASLAAWMCSRQARDVLQWSPKLAVLIGSYLSNSQFSLDSGIIPNISSLHIFGTNDYVVPAVKSLQVVDVFKQHETLVNGVLTSVHFQGHVIPKCNVSSELFESFLIDQRRRLLGSSNAMSTTSTNIRCVSIKGDGEKSKLERLSVMSAEEVAKAFVQHYYVTFDTNRPGLASLYQDVSNMSWEGQRTTGQQAIMTKLQGLPVMRHEYPTIDVQPSTSGNAIIIFVQGKLQIEENNPILFTQVFQLVAHQPGQYYIHNDIFRLQYG
ncbi:hypothetical protein PsorP6_013090 [Peronosclerospora sorghi]|uniref:Uncharacterized protein n=1 Tax=Peronosclerospora sorghi TaxID=230839 RepID=A0ACC0WEW3_9STRA|nr:hypothetical protein PsorP6_013090 [Peronosclerospora sorghi]